MRKEPRRGDAAKELVLVLVGSPRGLETSTSARLARLLLQAFSSEEWDVEWCHAHAVMQKGDERSRFIELSDRAALILLASPLYVDSLPAPTIAALQTLVAHRAGTGIVTNARSAALLNCGFLEPIHNLTCLQICECFARGARLEWAGGLMVGGGGMTNKRIKEALLAAGGSLASDLPVSGFAQESLAAPVMPRWLYILGGNRMWIRQAKKLGVSRKQLRARPYEREK